MPKKGTQAKPKRKKSYEPQQKRTKISLWSTILAIATLLGYLTLIPRPSVSLSDPSDPENPWTATVSITNLNVIPLEDAGLQFGVGQIVPYGDKGDASFIPSFGSRLVFTYWQHHKLAMDVKYDVALEDGLNFKNTRFADIAIIVSYRPWILPFHREKIFRFVTRKETDGKIHWYSYPTGEPPPASYLAN